MFERMPPYDFTMSIADHFGRESFCPIPIDRFIFSRIFILCACPRGKVIGLSVCYHCHCWYENGPIWRYIYIPGRVVHVAAIKPSKTAKKNDNGHGTKNV
jgi:hypothetical protein